MRNFIVCYDIANDKERNSLSKLLAGYGDRVQLSVFACYLDSTEFRQLRKVLSQKDIESGCISVYTLHPSKAPLHYGQHEPADKLEYSSVF